MEPSHIAVFTPDVEIFGAFSEALAQDCVLTHAATHAALQDELSAHPSVLLAIDLPEGSEDVALDASRRYAQGHTLVFIIHTDPTIALINAMLALQPEALVRYPLDAPALRDTVSTAVARARQRAHQRYLRQNLTEANRRLNQRLQEINTIYTVGKSVAASLDLDEVLERIVEASVNLTQAEEGFILLQEDEQLYLRIAKNMNEDMAQRFCVEASDKVAWQVIRSGRPTMLHRNTKIATGYLVRSLLYVPLIAPGRGTVGVLGVVNQIKDQSFTEHHLFTLSSVADFAAIALENARLFNVVAAERSRLGTILENATEAILVTGANNQLWLWSKAAAEIFDIAEDALGCGIEDCVDNAALRELFTQASEENATLHAEVVLEGGQVFNAQLSTIENVGRVVVMQDITHLKELDRLKSEFVSTVSHDLRTPLTTVLGYIELLERVGPLSEMQKSFIHKALKSLSHITDLIGDLLDIGRIEAGYDLELQPLKMDEVIHKVVEVFAIEAERNELTLHYDAPETPLWVQGNARRLRQVLENLISNAIKYNRPGGWIRVEAQPDDEHVIVSVQDSGIGIPLEEQPKVFERFYRVQTPETEDIHGTGLGLAIVKSVIEKHRGRIWVRSAAGEGSTFAFVLSACAGPDTSTCTVADDD